MKSFNKMQLFSTYIYVKMQPHKNYNFNIVIIVGTYKNAIYNH